MWTVQVKGVPQPVSVYEAVCINGKIYCFYTCERGMPIYVYICDPRWYRWDLVETQPLPDGGPVKLNGYTVVAYGDCAYLWGGTDDGESDHAVYRFNTNSMTWSRPEVRGDVPTTLFGHSACMVGPRMYIFGGLHRDAWHHVWFLDLDAMMWHRVDTTGEASADSRFFHTASAIGTRMYVWGGKVDGVWGRRYDRSVCYLETTTSTWVRPQVEGVPPEARQDHSGFVYKGHMYIFGGGHLDHGTDFADMHRYDPDKSCWTQVMPHGAGPCARRLNGCCVIGDRVFVFNGLRQKRALRDREQVRISPFDDESVTDMHVLDFAPSLKTSCLLALIHAGLEVARLPPINGNEIHAMMANDNTSSPS
ncbi:kelch domain-containing protein 3-like [Amblyomma americanum]